MKTFHPTAKLKVSENWEPGEVGALLGQQIAYFESLGQMAEVPPEKPDWKKLRLVYGKDIKKRVETYNKKLKEEFFPNILRGFKFAVTLALEQEYRILCKIFGTHVVGDLKRIEKMCQRLDLHLGRRGRPPKYAVKAEKIELGHHH